MDGQGQQRPGPVVVPVGFAFDEEDLAAEEAAIKEVAGEAPSSLDIDDPNFVCPALRSIFDTPLEGTRASEDALFDEGAPSPMLDDASEVALVDAPVAGTVMGAVAADASEAVGAPADASDAPEGAEAAPSAGSAAAGSTASKESAASNGPVKRTNQPHPRRAPKGANGSKMRFSLSYKARAILSFVMVSLLTVGICIGAVAFIWSQFFNTYAAANIENLAEQTANRMATIYEKTLSLEGDTLTPAIEVASSSEELGVVVSDVGGNTLYNSSTGDSLQNSPSSATQIAITPIEHHGQTVGNVRVWVYGSNTLMSKVDREFQRNMYAGLMYAAGISLVIALLLGILLARSLVKPVGTVTKTVRELSNGNLSARTGMQGDNEISCLGATIDDMAASFERDRKMEQRLTSDVAHELRTPLMAIQATVEAMIDGVYERDDEHLMLVDAEVARLSKLVDALLKLSRMEMRSQPMREEVVNLSDLADDMVISHEAFIEESGLSVHLDAQPGIKTIGDEDLIKQAVANLVSNAVRYTDEGGSITISVAREGRMAAISVADTGIGLSPDEEKMVFSRFWRADSGRAKEGGGLGVGLALVKEIVDRHHGRVSVKGEKGVGSVFTLYFPLYDEEKSIAQARIAVRAMERRARGGFFVSEG